MGETVVMEDNVSLLHGVTLGGSGCAKGLRHPIIRRGVLIGVGAKILGHIESNMPVFSSYPLDPDNCSCSPVAGGNAGAMA